MVGFIQKKKEIGLGQLSLFSSSHMRSSSSLLTLLVFSCFIRWSWCNERHFERQGKAYLWSFAIYFVVFAISGAETLLGDDRRAVEEEQVLFEQN